MPMRPHKRYAGKQKYFERMKPEGVWIREVRLALDELNYGSPAKARHILEALVES